MSQTLRLYISQATKYGILGENEAKTASRDRLILSHLRLAIHIAKRYAKTEDELLDRIQDANVGLCKAADVFDWDRGSFTVCADYYIRSEIRNNLRNGLGRIKRVDYENCSFQSSDITDLDSTLGDSPDAYDSVLYTSFVRRISDRATDRERQIIEMRVLGFTFEDIGETLNISRARVGQILEKFKEDIFDIKEELLNDI